MHFPTQRYIQTLDPQKLGTSPVKTPFYFIGSFPRLTDKPMTTSDGHYNNFIYYTNNPDEKLSSQQLFTFLLHLEPSITCASINKNKNSQFTSSFYKGEDKIFQINYDCESKTSVITVLKPTLVPFSTEVEPVSEKYAKYFISSYITDHISKQIFKYNVYLAFSPDHPFRKFMKKVKPYINDDILQQLIDFTSHDRYFKEKCEDTTDLTKFLDELNGIIKIYTTNETNPKYKIQYAEHKVHSLIWISDILYHLLESDHKSISCFELDVSFKAIKPYVFCIINCIIHNEGLPVGISIGPTEKVYIYSHFYETLRKDERFGGLYAKLLSIPILTDEGSALISLAAQLHLTQFFCFAHLIRKFSWGSALSGMVRDLLYSFSPEELNEKFKKMEMRLCISLSNSDKSTIAMFNKLFNTDFDSNTKTFQTPPSLDTQGLFIRKEHGIPTCTNHSESSHSKVNENKQKYISMDQAVIDVFKYVLQRQEAFPTNRNFKTAISNVLKQPSEDPEYCDHNCQNRRLYYKSLYGIDDFPCKHHKLEEVIQSISPNYPQISHDCLHSIQIQDNIYKDWGFKQKIPKLPDFPPCGNIEYQIFLKYHPIQINFEQLYKENYLNYKGIDQGLIINQLPEYFGKFCCYIYYDITPKSISDFIEFFAEKSDHLSVLNNLKKEYEMIWKTNYKKLQQIEEELTINEDTQMPQMPKDEEIPCINFNHIMTTRDSSIITFLRKPENPFSNMDAYLYFQIKQLPASILFERLVGVITPIEAIHICYRLSFNIFDFKEDIIYSFSFSSPAWKMFVLAYIVALKNTNTPKTLFSELTMTIIHLIPTLINDDSDLVHLYFILYNLCIIIEEQFKIKEGVKYPAEKKEESKEFIQAILNLMDTIKRDYKVLLQSLRQSRKGQELYCNIHQAVDALTILVPLELQLELGIIEL